MQFHHAHTLRGPVVDALHAEMPDVLDDLVAAGARIAGRATGGPRRCCAGAPPSTRCYDAARSRSRAITVLTGHVDGLSCDDGRVRGVTWRRRRDWPPTSVIDASGRASRFTSAVRAPCRRRRLRRGLRQPAVPIPRRRAVRRAGELTDRAVTQLLRATSPSRFCTTTARSPSASPMTAPTDDCATCGSSRLRSRRARDPAARRSGPIRIAPRPIAPVLPGGRLYNGYRGQLDARDARHALA